MSAFDHFAAMDAQLVAAEFPATSPWWRETLGGFYATGRRQLVLRCGRRGGKSSTLCRVAVLEALAGEHHVPPGDLGVVAFISTTRDEAAKRLRTVEVILKALHVGYKPLREGQGFELLDKPVAFQVFVASVSGVSGPTVICAVCDEVAKWRDSDTGSNPAKEVLASLRPTMATMPRARMFLSSSPMGVLDAHATAFDLGDTDFQAVAHAETWIANPSVSEAATHGLEPDERLWSREYAAIPGSELSAAFEADEIDRAIHTKPPCSWVGRPALVIDPSSLRNDRFTYAVVRWAYPATTRKTWVRPANNGAEVLEETPLPFHAPFLDICELGGWEPPARPTGEVARVLVALAQKWKISGVHSDSYDQGLWSSVFFDAGYHFTNHHPSQSDKAEAVSRIRGWLRDGEIVLPKHDLLTTELKRFGEKLSANGSFSYAAKGSGHDDFVSLLIISALADIAMQLGGSPLAKTVRRSFAALA